MFDFRCWLRKTVRGVRVWWEFNTYPVLPVLKRDCHQLTHWRTLVVLIVLICFSNECCWLSLWFTLTPKDLVKMPNFFFFSQPCIKFVVVTFSHHLLTFLSISVILLWTFWEWINCWTVFLQHMLLSMIFHTKNSTSYLFVVFFCDVQRTVSSKGSFGWVIQRHMKINTIF